MGLFSRKPPSIDLLGAARVTLLAREWAKELGGFQSPEADAVLLGMCTAATSVSGALAERQGKNRDNVQWECICQGLKEYPDVRRRLAKFVPLSQIRPSISAFALDSAWGDDHNRCRQ